MDSKRTFTALGPEGSNGVSPHSSGPGGPEPTQPRQQAPDVRHLPRTTAPCQHSAPIEFGGNPARRHLPISPDRCDDGRKILRDGLRIPADDRSQRRTAFPGPPVSSGSVRGTSHFGFDKDGKPLADSALPANLTADWLEQEENAGKPFPSYARLLPLRGRAEADSRHSWTVDFAARRAKAHDEMLPVLAQAAETKGEVIELKEKLKRLRKSKASDGELAPLVGKINEKEKAARALEAQAAGIDAAVFDLKVGNPTETVLASGTRETGTYDPRRGWPTRLSVFEPAWTTPLLDTIYTRSATGRITRADTEAPEGDLDYAYDYAGRLLSAANFSGLPDFSQSFAYDAAGRMRQNSRVGAYSYTPGGPFHAPDAIALTGGGTLGLVYDANGNMLAGLDGKVMEYDGENRPLGGALGAKKTCYVYGAGGARLMKIEDIPAAIACPSPAFVPPGATVYFGPMELRGFDTLTEEVVAYPHPSVRIVDGVESYLHRDALASVRAVTGADGAADETAVYRPFGEQQEWVLDVAAAGESKGFVGERYDADAGLQFLNADMTSSPAPRRPIRSRVARATTKSPGTAAVMSLSLRWAMATMRSLISTTARI